MFIRNAIIRYFWPTDADEKKESVKPDATFLERLEKIQHDLLLVPELFNCPINLSIMEHPFIVNSHRSHVFEAAALNQWLATNPTTDPLRTKINLIKVKGVFKEDIKPDITRKNQIEKFVSSLEQIHVLNKMLHNLEQTTVDILDNAFQELDIAPEHREQLLHAQREEQAKQRKEVLHIKLKLYLELDIFINDTTLIIESEDKREEEKLAEINRITGDKQDILKQLREELEPVFPDIFSNQPQYHSNDLQLYPSTLSLNQLMLCGRQRSSWQNTLFYSPVSTFSAPSMMVFAYLYALALKSAPRLIETLNTNQEHASHRMTVFE